MVFVTIAKYTWVHQLPSSIQTHMDIHTYLHTTPLDNHSSNIIFISASYFFTYQAHTHGRSFCILVLLHGFILSYLLLDYFILPFKSHSRCYFCQELQWWKKPLSLYIIIYLCPLYVLLKNLFQIEILL